MIEMMKSYNEKNFVANEFIQRSNPYEKWSYLNFDLRGYASYVKEHTLTADDITPKIMNMFIKK